MSNLIRDSWKYYKLWMKSDTFSKALNSKILVTRLAWDHVVRGNKSSPRSFKDKARRLLIMKESRYVLINAKDFVKTSKDGYIYYELKMKLKKQDIKVIVREDRKGSKVLYSWMKK